ncbi:MAG: hypothetical protein A2502_11690 [Candidatus Edwardsbacteria bacterium RifOxyC12_full_54_24]|nr:MAG: hypothetical protein A2502_11690 [Candidatus Edwardsbacteria bacterium RifOxyC12_full_54_24]
MKKISKIPGSIRLNGSKAVLVFLSLPFFILALLSIIVKKYDIWQILYLSIFGTLPAVIFDRLTAKVGFGHRGKDIDLPDSLKRLKTYYSSNVVLVKGALFHIIAPMILVPLFSIIYDKIALSPVGDYFQVIKSHENIWRRFIVASMAWNFSCYFTVGYYNSHIIIKKWKYIQENYPPWPERASKKVKEKILSDGGEEHIVSPQEEALSVILDGGENYTRGMKFKNVLYFLDGSFRCWHLLPLLGFS